MLKGKCKRVLSFVLCLVLTLTVAGGAAFSASAASYDASKLVSKAESYVGQWWGTGLCLNFVANMVSKTYGTIYNSACCAYKYGSTHIDSTNKNNIPVGADVFFTGSSSTCNKCKNKCGHVGIYVGDGYIVHDWAGYVRKHKISDITKSGSYSFRGWGWHGNMSFSTTNTTNTTTSSTLKTGTWYKFTNSKSNKLLNVYGSKSTSNTNVTVYQKDGTSGQDFKLVANGTKNFNNKTYTKYVIVPRCASKCALNVYGTSAKNGANVNIWTKSGNSTQDWIIVPVSNGYVIRSANNTNYVLTASGTSNSSNVKLATYSSGNTYQIWKLS
ncbi:MAG: RICIN domain-containing protein [Clostridia bacterium]|nr:RICIN domain-containing protein [Clostridia bacterium]